MLKEEFLFFVWRYRLFDFKQLKTTAGESLEIFSTGDQNFNAGPDFLHARVKIGETSWVGNIEMHIKASEWNIHQHDLDSAYNTVILHVVWDADQDIQNQSGVILPCFEIRNRVSDDLLHQYKYLMASERWVPCEALIHYASEITKESWLNRLMIERLELKSQAIDDSLITTNMDWEQSFYQKLARSMGMNINGEAMETLARIAPMNILYKIKDRLFSLEAFLFGQAGFLEKKGQDDYLIKLKNEYEFLKKKNDLRPMNPAQWKFMRMRPANFPTIRIAQLATILFSTSHLFSKIMAAQNIKELHNTLNLEVAGYWKNHFTFDKASAGKVKRIGKTALNNIIINTIIPFVYHYGRKMNDETYQAKALRWMHELPAESNILIKKWASLNWKADHALHSQALIHLKHHYCDQKKCLSCSVGLQVIKHPV